MDKSEQRQLDRRSERARYLQAIVNAPMGEPPALVSAETRCRPTRLRFLETERLQRRFAWLTENKGRLAQEADGRKRLREVALEFHEIERELAKRFIEG